MANRLAALLDAYNAHDAATAVALYRDDGEHREIAQGGSHRGHHELRSSLEHFLAAFPDAHWEPVGVTGGASLAAAPYRLTGTLSAPLGPFVPTGQRLDIEGVMVACVDDERSLIAWTADYWDAGTFARQMKG
jgi:steroid delta-isomerase-like uncharacterized protein